MISQVQTVVSSVKMTLLHSSTHLKLKHWLENRSCSFSKHAEEVSSAKRFFCMKPRISTAQINNSEKRLCRIVLISCLT